MPDTELARRMFEAINAFEKRRGKRLTFEELGALVAAEQDGRDEDYSPSVVARWVKGQQTPRTLDQWAALARALGVNPGWLTFGTGSMEASEIGPAGGKGAAGAPYHGEAPAQETPVGRKAAKKPRKTG